MRSADIDRRLNRIEERTGLGETVYGVHLTDVAMVAVTGTDERLTLDDFRTHYPAGVIIRQFTSEMWDAL